MEATVVLTDEKVDDLDVMTREPEEVADHLLNKAAGHLRVYTERQLARKMRLERKRLPELNETRMSDLTADYLLHRHLELMVTSAKLTKTQAALLKLIVDGWRPIDIANEYGFDYKDVLRRIRILTSRIQRGGSPYDGLYEVYWSEVNRRGYRRR